jgi:hypothetical protein
MPRKKIKQSTLNFNDFSINKLDINIPPISAKPIIKHKIVEKKTLDSSNNILEVYIDNNENNRKFLELTNKEKNQVIEIGLINKQTFNNKQLAWSNEDWERKLNIIENKKQKEKQRFENDKATLMQKIKELERIINTNKADFSIKMKEQENALTEKIQLLYKNDLTYKELKIEELKQELVEKNSEIGKQHEKHQNILFEKLNAKEEMHKKEREQLRMEKDSQVLKEIQKMNAKTEVASVKGKLGEKKLMEVLKEYRPEDDFKDVGQKGGKGDIIQNTGKYIIMHEAKLYDKQMKTTEVKKFIKDMKNNKDINAGIMTSFNTHIPCKTNQSKSMHFEFVEGKPAFYIAHFSKNTEIIDFAMKMCVSLLDSNINMNEAEEMGRIIKLINTSLQNVSKQEKALTTFVKSHERNINDIKKNLNLTLELFK